MRKILIIVLYCLLRPVYANLHDICILCPVNMYCSDSSIADCPVNSESPVGSTRSLDCTCKVGWYGTPDGECSRDDSIQANAVNNTLPLDVPFAFEIALRMNFTEFTAPTSDMYMSAVANAFFVTLSNVGIRSIEEQSPRRRTSTTTILVQTNVMVPFNMTGQKSTSDAMLELRRVLRLLGMLVVDDTNLDTFSVPPINITSIPPNITNSTIVSSFEPNRTIERPSNNHHKGTSTTFPILSLSVILVSCFMFVCLCCVGAYVKVRRRTKTVSLTCGSFHLAADIVIPITEQIHDNTPAIVEATCVTIQTPRSLSIPPPQEIYPTVPSITCDLFNSNIESIYDSPTTHTNPLMKPTGSSEQLHDHDKQSKCAITRYATNRPSFAALAKA
jgi:hypothetical protein